MNLISIVLFVSVFAGFNISTGSSTSWPWNSSLSNTARFQQVYAASQFPGPILISQMAYRQSTSNGSKPIPFTTSYGEVRIDLSTTSRPVNGLSFTFADNVGPDNTLVRDSALVLSSTADASTPGIAPYDITIDFANPFFYNPALGNLLVDIRNYDDSRGLPPQTGGFEAASPAGQAFTSTVSTNQLGNVNNLTANTSFDGYVTQFNSPNVAASTPEPGSLSLMGTGLVGLAAWRRRHKAVTR